MIDRPTEAPALHEPNVMMHRFLRWFVALLAPVALTAASLPPSFGRKSPENHPVPELRLIYEQDFEEALTGLDLARGGAQLTSDTNRVVAGARSLRLPAPQSTLFLPPSVLHLEAQKTYLVEFRYRLVPPRPGNVTLVIGFQWPGLDLTEEGNLSGPFDGIAPNPGVYQHSMRIAATDQAEIVFVTNGGEAILDEIQVYQYEATLRAPEPPLIRAGFPRLSSFHLASTTRSSAIYGVPRDEVVQTLGLFDLVSGISFDHTVGVDNDYFWLKRINPNIILLPYFGYAVAHLDGANPVGGSAGLYQLFNAGLEEDWFMRDPEGNPLNELLYPLNFQMNHTVFGAEVNGLSFVDYVDYFLGETVLPTGLWDGICFDESTWYPNPLLGNPDPYFSTEVVLPPIDLDGDGAPESTQEIYQAWAGTFESYFDRLAGRLGPNTLLFGNASAIPRNASVLRRLNGMQWEFFSPYAIRENGDWDTAKPSKWYEFVSANELAHQYLRGPQLPACQFTGYNLGASNGSLTENGIPDRAPVLESRDFRRMRLGLATALLGSSFFSYDYVDNSTVPTAWFDEYAVGPDGRPSKTLAAKGYLGQPLGPAQELDFARNEVVVLDFEAGGTVSDDYYVDPTIRISDSPEEVVDGSRAGVLTYENEAEEGVVLFATLPESLPLQAGAVYHLFADYRILAYRPVKHEVLLAAVIGDLNDPEGFGAGQFSAVYDADAEVGQKGTLRAACKVEGAGYSAAIFLADVATVAIDNIRLINGTGGVFRRDFENGVVLVNPTPGPITVAASEIAGTLRRTGLRRIAGVQDPSWNTGASVTQAVTLPSGDAIILLADHVSAPWPETPSHVTASPADMNATLRWDTANGTVAGYLIKYGLTGGDLTQFQIVGDLRECTINGLAVGSNYRFQVLAFDYYGNLSAPSASVSVQTPGPRVNRPMIAGRPRLVPGQSANILGQGFSTQAVSNNASPPPTVLANARVFVNGIAAPLRSVRPNEIELIAPANLAGDKAILRVEASGVSSPSVYAELPTAGTNAAVRLTGNWTNGLFRLRGVGVPGRAYAIEASDSLKPPSWFPLGTRVAATNGEFIFVDTTAPPPLRRFYRAALP